MYQSQILSTSGDCTFSIRARGYVAASCAASVLGGLSGASGTDDKRVQGLGFGLGF